METRNIEKYLIKESEIQDIDTITSYGMTVRGKLFCGFGSRIRMIPECMEFMEKQFELLHKYLGIQVEKSDSGKYRHWQLYIDSHNMDDVPDYIQLILRSKYWVIIKITNVRKYIQTCNNMMEEYWNWCDQNHISCDAGLILPNASHNSAGVAWNLKTDRQRNIDLQTLKEERKKNGEPEAARIQELREKMISLMKSGTMDIKNIKVIYSQKTSDPGLDLISFNINDLYHGFWSIDDNKYLYIYDREIELFTMEIWEYIMFQCLTEWKKGKTRKEHDDGSCNRFVVKGAECVYGGIVFNEHQVDVSCLMINLKERS
jgi:hypothetical protein